MMLPVSPPRGASFVRLYLMPALLSIKQMDCVSSTLCMCLPVPCVTQGLM